LLAGALKSAALEGAQAPGGASDPRRIETGSVIPDEGYVDQPYVVRTDDGAWLCVLTTGPAVEGAPGQHVVTRRSLDRGKTWRDFTEVEPSSGPEASYAVLLKVPSGRVYAFYTYNADRVREVIAEKPAFPDGLCRRVDSLGRFVFKLSDDGGRSWSLERYEVPVREFEIDRRNPYGGKLRFFWNVGRPFVSRGAAYVPLTKVGGFGEGFFTSDEGVLLRSENVLAESDPARIRWETLPEGDVGIRAPAGGGPIAEEHSYSVLADGSLFCVFRTIDGHPAWAHSRDGGRTWEPPEYLRFADGRLAKHPRAANFAWRCENGKFLYWFHHHGGRSIREHPRRRTVSYEDRNPAWLSGGIEVDAPGGRRIAWSEPEIVLYDDDPMVRISYPDLVEDGGRYFLTETEKEVARVHEIDRTLVESLWRTLEDPSGEVAREGLLLELPRAGEPMPAEAAAPKLPELLRRRPGGLGTERLASGFSIEAWLEPPPPEPGATILSNRTEDGRGFELRAAAGGAFDILLGDGRTQCLWASDQSAIEGPRRRHVVAIVDGGPGIILFVVDGKLSDGGDARQFGWGRLSPHLRSANGAPVLEVAPARTRRAPEIVRLRLYGRALRVAEAIGNFRAGP
ncbi:MAG: exo-alpha-sialidase, partial [Planctomycetota bacterium]